MEKVTMERTKELDLSSSFTCELFGSKESSSSSGIFRVIFASPSKVLGRDSMRSGVPGKKQDMEDGTLNTKLGAPDDTFTGKGSNSQNITKNDMSAIYQEHRVQPCHLSSSIYYGGQDIYSHRQSTQNPGLNSIIKKDGGKDDSGSASRGNWWQGSLYY